VRTLERGLKWAAKSDKRSITLPMRGGAIVLRADTKTIAVQRTFSHDGYTLQAGGKLSPADGQRLEKALERRATRGGILASLREQMRSRRAEQRRLTSADRKIDSILVDAKSGGSRERVLHRGATGDIRFRMGMSGGMLVIGSGFNERALFLGGDERQGYSLRSADRTAVAEALLGARR